MKKLAIIPARGGSKRIPRKNIKSFFGKPIIAHSIEIALSSELFDEVMVSTEDDEIAEIAIKYGAKVPFRRSGKNANDYATTIDVIFEVLHSYRTINRDFDYACCIYPAAPLIKQKHLKEGLDILISNDFDSTFPAIAFGYPIWRGLTIDDNHKVKMVWPNYLNTRSQDLETVYHDAGQWYWFNTKMITDSLFTSNSGTLVLSENEVQDIDTLSDWNLTELKYKLNKYTNE